MQASETGRWSATQDLFRKVQESKSLHRDSELVKVVRKNSVAALASVVQPLLAALQVSTSNAKLFYLSWTFNWRTCWIHFVPVGILREAPQPHKRFSWNGFMDQFLSSFSICFEFDWRMNEKKVRCPDLILFTRYNTIIRMSNICAGGWNSRVYCERIWSWWDGPFAPRETTVLWNENTVSY